MGAAAGNSAGISRLLHVHLATTTLLILQTMYTVLMMLNLLGCLWWYLARVEGLENSWAASVENKQYDMLSADGVTHWLTSLYFVT